MSATTEQEIFAEFDSISQNLDQVAALRDEIRPAVQRLESHSRQLQSVLFTIYSGREGAGRYGHWKWVHMHL